MSGIAISYARFSSMGQADGDSIERQVKRAKAYALANDLILEEKYTFKDLAKSGYTGENVESGELGVLLEAIKKGEVPKGATLIVESLDRLSRQEPMDAFDIFRAIINAGLNLVVLTVNGAPKTFNRASIRENPFQLFEVMLDQLRSNAESGRKSDLLSESWEKRRKQAIESKSVMTSLAPLWLVRDGPKFVFDKERVQVVRRVLDMARSGIGNHTIIKTLNSEGVPSWPRSEKEQEKRREKGLTHIWQPSYIQKMLSQPALYGAVQIKGGELVEGYYPAVITRDEYEHLQALRRIRAKRTPSTRRGVAVTNLFSGLLRCGYCGSKMIVNSYGSKTLKVAYKYVACHGARTAASQCRMFGWELKKLENAILAFLPEVNFGQVLGKTDQTGHEVVALLEQQVDDLKTKIERVYVAIEEGATGMVPRVKAHEAELNKAEKLLKDKRSELASTAIDPQNGVDQYIEARKGMVAAKNDPIKLRAIREQLSSLIAQSVERVVLYPKGRGMQGSASMDLHFKSGVMREHTPEYVEF